MPILRERFPQPKVKINLMARFNPNHYGYVSDLVQGILNTAWFSIANFKFGHSNAPITARFVDESGNPLIPNQTMCSNLDESNRIFEPYHDEIIPERLVDRIEYIDNTNDTVTTIIS